MRNNNASFLMRLAFFTFFNNIAFRDVNATRTSSCRYSSSFFVKISWDWWTLLEDLFICNVKLITNDADCELTIIGSYQTIVAFYSRSGADFFDGQLVFLNSSVDSSKSTCNSIEVILNIFRKCNYETLTVKLHCNIQWHGRETWNNFWSRQHQWRLCSTYTQKLRKYAGTSTELAVRP